jgi:hypothetical protein
LGAVVVEDVAEVVAVVVDITYVVAVVGEDIAEFVAVLL